jgi:hypothetical protein
MGEFNHDLKHVRPFSFTSPSPSSFNVPQILITPITHLDDDDGGGDGDDM